MKDMKLEINEPLAWVLAAALVVTLLLGISLSWHSIEREALRLGYTKQTLQGASGTYWVKP